MVDACGRPAEGWRRMEAPPDAADLVPLDRYDSARAKIAANLQWICAKAYGLDNVPEDLRDPFYMDQYEQEHIKPPVTKLLLSSELYCRVCSLILPGDQAAALHGHQAVIQALSRKGIYVMEGDDTPVTEPDLSRAPIKMSAHMAMVDALMMAYTVEMISIEKVVASVKRFSTFSASKELPYDLEDAMVFWINKVNLKMREIAEKDAKLKQQSLESPAHQKPGLAHALLHCMLEPVDFARVVRYRREHPSARQSPYFPWVEDLMRDSSDGAALLAVIHYYCPEQVKLDAQRDGLHRGALLVVRERQARLRAAQGRAGAEGRGRGASAFSPSHPLLPLRQKQQKPVQGEDPSGQRHRSNSLTRVDGQPRGAATAWPERKTRPVSQPTPAVHHAASCDVDPGSGDSISLARSISKDSLASSVVHLTPQHRPQPAAAETSGRSLLTNVSIEDEEEELAAIIGSDVAARREDPAGPRASPRAPGPLATARPPQWQADGLDSKPDSFFLEPLMPAVLKPAKEKQVVSKEDELGEGRPRSSTAKRPSDGHQPLGRRRLAGGHGAHDLNRTFTPIPCPESPTSVAPAEAGPPPPGAAGEACGGPPAVGGLDLSPQGQSADGFFLHVGAGGRMYIASRSPSPRDSEPWAFLGQGSDSDGLDVEEVEHVLMGEESPVLVARYDGEEESAKLQEDMQLKEHEDKDDASGRSSPCLSTASRLSSVSAASGGVTMTSFAERKLQRLNSCETKSSTSSSQKTTPDGSESCPAPLTTWRQKREQSPGRRGRDAGSLLASELAQLRMQLEEKRRAIEAQKKRVEASSARQRLRLGKAAFLHVVRKGKAEGAPQLPRPEPSQHGGEDLDAGVPGAEEQREALLGESAALDVAGLALVQHRARGPAALHDAEKTKALSAALLEDGLGEAADAECELSIEKLNASISTLQQAILRISQQQEQLLLQSPAAPAPAPAPRHSAQDQRARAPVPLGEPLSPPGTAGHRKPPRLGQGRSSRAGRPAELKVPKDRPQGSSRSKTPTPSAETLPHLRALPPSSHARTPSDPDAAAEPGGEPHEESPCDGYRLYHESKQRALAVPAAPDPNILAEQMGLQDGLGAGVREAGPSPQDGSGKVAAPAEEPLRSKASLIEVDLADLRAPGEDGEGGGHDRGPELPGDADQKPGVGFFFKDEQKAEDELAKRRAAFLLKQQRKAEEARARKQQLEAEVELKRDEARRKAEEDRVRKEEEKARRELIKQEYLRRKQQQILEEQGLAKPKSKPKKPRPKSVHREESCSDSGTKCSSTPDNLSRTQSGSSLSLASAATTEPESVHSGGTPSQRVESMEALPILSRNPSRSTDRDWETASAASSLASVAEYTGPRLFKEPSSKSNKPIIHNAVCHCCLAGKVNEPHKDSVLQELEKCDANHYIILFRDAGCQFRALYCYYPDSEEIHKLTGTGPRSITRKMIDKLYKYSSDRKQFNLIPAKTMSVSVDALTIHNHLWQPKRPAAPKKAQNRK
nr:calmodulin-regulated spectrin-associated protein 1 isoform X4 [Oryctolagus cuniculus]